jgi:hypothetical protein
MKRIIIIAIFGLISCEKPVNLDIPSDEPKLVLNSFFSPDEAFIIHLSGSVSVMDTSINAVNDARIIIFENDRPIDTLCQGSEGYYLSNITAKRNNIYSIKAEHENYPAISASDILPEKTAILSATHVKDAGYDEEGRLYDQINIRFSDPAHTENFYEAAIYHLYTYNGQQARNALVLFSNSSILINEGDLEYYPNYVVFSDKLLHETNEIDLNFFFHSELDNSRLILQWRNISRDYYTYRKSIIRHLNNQQSDIWGGTGEPIQLYSNIKNGHGIFAGFVLQTDSFPK